MRPPYSGSFQRKAYGLRALLTTSALLGSAWTASAQTAYTAAGWLDRVLAPPIVCSNALGQVLLRATAFTLRVDSADPRLAGRRTVFWDGYYQTNGPATIYGTTYHEVGSWAGNNFTPAGGLCELRWRGVMQPDYSLQASKAGYGSGGVMEGIRLAETMTRTKASSIFDPGVAFLITGTIKPPPVNTTEVYDDFTRPYTCPIYGFGTVISGNGQFTLIGDFQVPTGTFDDSFVYGEGSGGSCAKALTIPNGTTCEWRADLVSLDDNATNIPQLVVSAAYSPGYSFFKGRDFAFLVKWSLDFTESVLWCERSQVSLPNSNVVLAVALTRIDPNLFITTRVLDKAGTNVLFTRTFKDTPESEPSLTTPQFETLTGMHIVGLGTDAAEAPPTQVGPLLGLFQYTDGHLPVPTAIFENLVLWTSEIPPISIERTVRLVWPVSTRINYVPQWASTVLGPWEPVPDQAIPGMNQMTVPASDHMRVFQLIEGP